MEEKEMETGIQFPVPDEELQGRRIVVVGCVGVGKSGSLASVIEALREKGCEVVRVEDMNNEIVTDPLEELSKKMQSIIDATPLDREFLQPVHRQGKNKHTKPSYHRKNFWE